MHRMSAQSLTGRTRVRMTTLRVGQRAVLSGAAAAWWWEADDRFPSQITVTMPVGDHRRDVPGTRVRHRRLDAEDQTIHRGLAVTSVPLSVLEAGVESGLSIVDDAVLRELVTVDGLAAAYQRRRKCEDAAAMGRIIEALGSGARSAAEREAVAIFEAHGIDGWVAGYPCLGYDLLLQRSGDSGLGGLLDLAQRLGHANLQFFLEGIVATEDLVDEERRHRRRLAAGRLATLGDRDALLGGGDLVAPDGPVLGDAPADALSLIHISEPTRPY